jgi:multiple antibiotic resistance protein
MSVTVFINTFFNLLAVLNPLVVAAVYFSMLTPGIRAQHANIVRKFTIAVAVILLIDFWFGRFILDLFGISLAACNCTGGLILIIIGVSLVLPSPATQDQKSTKNLTASIAIIPLAIPLCAGPGVIPLVIGLSVTYPTHPEFIMLSSMMLLLALMCGLILYFAPSLSKKLGPIGMDVVEKIMGIIVVAIGFSTLLKGITAIYPPH